MRNRRRFTRKKLVYRTIDVIPPYEDDIYLETNINIRYSSLCDKNKSICTIES